MKCIETWEIKPLPGPGSFSRRARRASREIGGRGDAVVVVCVTAVALAIALAGALLA